MLKRFSLFLATLLVCNACLAGAWGPGSFDNDDALDWIASCTASKGAQSVVDALQAAIKPGPLEASEGAAAIAAAELVAAANGKPGKTLPKELKGWLQRQPREKIAGLASVARKALARVKDPKSSELRQLWTESGEKPWLHAVGELDARLQ